MVRDGAQLGDVFGLYTVAVMDGATYHAAEGVRYVVVPGAAGRAPLLSLRNALVHLLTPGGSAYDLATRAHSLAAPAPGETVRHSQLIPLVVGAAVLGDIIAIGLILGKRRRR